MKQVSLVGCQMPGMHFGCVFTSHFVTGPATASLATEIIMIAGLELPANTLDTVSD